MGGKSKQTQTSQTTIDPTVMKYATDNYGRAQGIANTPATPYSGPLTASMESTPIDTSGAQGTLSGLLGYNAPTVTAGQLKDTDLSSYLNPFTSDVIDASARDSEQQRLTAQTANKSAATHASAFGGSRAAVQAGVTDSQNEIAFAQLAAQLRSQGYSTAQANALADIQMKLSADQGNQGASISSAGIRSGAATGLAGIQLQQAQQEAAQRAAQAQLEAGNNSALYQEFIRQQNDPLVKQGLLTSALGSIPVPQSTTQTSKSTPGLFDYVNMGAKAAAAAFGG